MVNSIKKGKKFELKIAKQLGRWWCDDETAFRRTPQSGGWPRKGSAGDIQQVKYVGEKFFPFCLELKNREGWSFEEFLISKKDKGRSIEAWWVRLREIADNCLRLPMLVFTRNYGSVFVVLQRSIVLEWGDYVGSRRQWGIGWLEGRLGNEDVIVFEWKALTGVVDAEMLRDWCKVHEVFWAGGGGR